jgi:putative colanic acid biosynthesis acetyltransferase WcaF
VGFDRGAPRWKEALWVLVKRTMFFTSLPIPSAIRVAVLRAFGARVGKGVVVRSRVNITFPWRIEMGDFVWLGEEVLILSLARVCVGSNVCISQRAFLCTGSHDYRCESFSLVTKPITVGSRSWIAAQAFVGPGVRVGEGAVVSAGAVVMNDVPADTLVLGNPAYPLKTIRRREVSPTSIAAGLKQRCPGIQGSPPFPKRVER